MQNMSLFLVIAAAVVIPIVRCLWADSAQMFVRAVVFSFFMMFSFFILWVWLHSLRLVITASLIVTVVSDFFLYSMGMSDRSRKVRRGGAWVLSIYSLVVAWLVSARSASQLAGPGGVF